MTRGWRMMLLAGTLTAGTLAAEASEPVRPAAPPDCDFRLTCQLGSHRFSVSFDSLSGECTEDDMRALVEGPGGKTELPLERGWYSPIPNIANGKSTCQVAGAPASGVSAFAVEGGRVLVFFGRDGRPGYDSVGVALIEAATGKLLDVRQGLGQSMALLPVPHEPVVAHPGEPQATARARVRAVREGSWAAATRRAAWPGA